MPDSLRTLVERYDRAHARRNRLTDAVVLPARPGAATRRVCRSCWHVVDEQAEYRAWVDETEKRCGCWSKAGWPLREHGWGHWDAALREYTYHDFPGVSACPRCGGELAEVTP